MGRTAARRSHDGPRFRARSSRALTACHRTPATAAQLASASTRLDSREISSRSVRLWVSKRATSSSPPAMSVTTSSVSSARMSDALTHCAPSCSWLIVTSPSATRPRYESEACRTRRHTSDSSRRSRGRRQSEPLPPPRVRVERLPRGVHPPRRNRREGTIDPPWPIPQPAAAAESHHLVRRTRRPTTRTGQARTPMTPQDHHEAGHSQSRPDPSSRAAPC